MYSLNTILEISEPLNHPSESRVMQTLNDMDEFPHVFISESEISKLELLELITSYDEGREFNKNQIMPYRKRFDYVLAPYGGYSHQFLKYDLNCIIFDLWSQKALKSFRSYYDLFKKNVETERHLSKIKNITKFQQFIEKELRRNTLTIPENIRSLVKWTKKNIERAPSLQLSFYLFQSLVRNNQDKTNKSDIGDLINLISLPYVDIISVDRRMASYINQNFKNYKPLCHTITGLDDVWNYLDFF